MNTARERIKVLFIEDDPDVADLYQKILRLPGRADLSFDVKWVDTLAKAMEHVTSGKFDVILLDLMLPDSNGFDTFIKVKAQAQDTPIIILTGSEDEMLALNAVSEGAQDYIPKGQFECNMFLHAIAYALERSRIQKDLQNAKKDLEAKVRERTCELQTEKDRLQRVLVESVDSLGFALAKRDPYTAGHQRRVAKLSIAIAKSIGLSEDTTIGLSLAALVHDIGKIGVPLAILVKPDQLSENEMNAIRLHSEAGHSILKDIEFSWPIAEIVFQHHERINGSGYPRGLSGDAILMESKILCVADVVEAMASDRPYRPAIGIQGALEELSCKRGILYEPTVVDACLELFQKNGFKFE